ncbi:MAG TPA: L,D-transpeptidase/peptidoglycan binding protein [Solirubrobacteraceae bacterium]|jgi:lipoprotein-anchoring transpeptidase ErfK/SrfK
MRTRSFALVTAFIVLLLVGAGAVYAYDSSRSSKIADGVTISGVDVGGLNSGEARDKIQAELLEPLKRPVTVRWRDHRFHLTARQARVGIDLDGSVDRALAKSRRGNLFTRTIRGLTGDGVDADVPVDITYDKSAIRRLVRRVAGAVDRPARDADVSIDGSGVSRTPSHDGIEVVQTRLRQDVDEKLLATTGSKTVRVATKTVKPEVTTAEVAEKYPAILIVNRSAFRLTLYKDLKMVKSYPIAVGQAGLETPPGRYTIQNKAVNPAWHVPNSAWAGSLAGQVIPGGAPNNPIKARWLGVYDGVGVHGTSDDASIGSNASHGCIRMHVPDVEDLYPRVPVGSPIYIA